MNRNDEISYWITLPRVPWGRMTTDEIREVASDAGRGGDVTLARRAERALERRRGVTS